MGYGLLRVTGDDVEVEVEAKPKKVYKSERDYCEVASKGLLRMAAIKALINAGLEQRAWKCIRGAWGSSDP